MARPKSDGATATAERKPRARKSPKEKAETLTVRAINALRKLGEIDLTETNREEINAALDSARTEMKQAWDAMDESETPPDVFKLS